MTRVALYARYSSDQQRESSVEDQLRLCRLHAERQGWIVADSYHDRAVSGTFAHPPWHPSASGPRVARPLQGCAGRGT